MGCLCSSNWAITFFGTSASVDALFYFAHKWKIVGKFSTKESATLADFEKMYYELFNGIRDTIEKLKELQQNAEKLYSEQK